MTTMRFRSGRRFDSSIKLHEVTREVVTQTEDQRQTR